MQGEQQPRVWQRSILDGTGYNIKSRLELWQRRGTLSALACRIILRGLGEGQAFDVYHERNKPVVEMNGERYTAREFDELVNLAAVAGGEQAGVN